MYVLPETPHEFTQFALEQQGHTRSFYSRVLDRSINIDKFAVRAWVHRTACQHAELCRIEQEQDPTSRYPREMYRLYIAGVWILTNHKQVQSVEHYACRNRPEPSCRIRGGCAACKQT